MVGLCLGTLLKCYLFRFIFYLIYAVSHPCARLKLPPLKYHHPAVHEKFKPKGQMGWINLMGFADYL